MASQKEPDANERVQLVFDENGIQSSGPDILEVPAFVAPELSRDDDKLGFSSDPDPDDVSGLTEESAEPRKEMFRQNRSSRRRPPRVKKSDVYGVDPGADFERRVARVEFAEGALSRIRVPVHADADRGRSILTDIDVLSVEVDLRLRVSIGIQECKSGAGQSGEPDRLFWLAGFQKYLGADRATLVRQTTTRRGQSLARKLALRILDNAILEQSEASHAWVPERFAHVAGPGCKAIEARTDTQLKGLQSIPPALISALRYEVFAAPSYQIIGYLLALSRAVEGHEVLPSPAGEVLAGHSLLALFLAAIRDAGLLDVIPLAELRRRLELALTVGSPDDSHVLEVLDDADALLREIVERTHLEYQRFGAARIDVDLPSLRAIVAEPPSKLIDRYLDLVERLRSNPAVGRDMLQTTELVCFDALAGDEAWKAPAFDHLFTPEHRQLLLIGVHTLTEVASSRITDRLRGIDELPFNRTAPPLPDRRTLATEVDMRKNNRPPD